MLERSIYSDRMDAEKNKSQILQELGRRIAETRRVRGISIERLAYGVGISKGNLSDIENCKRDPRYTTLLAIAEGLELPLSQLLKDL